MWIIGQGVAFHRECCGMVTKGKKAGETKSIMSRKFTVELNYKS